MADPNATIINFAQIYVFKREKFLDRGTYAPQNNY